MGTNAALPPSANGGICVPTTPAIAPLRLASDYRDYYGRQHEKFVERIDPIIQAGCFTPRIFHAPASADEVAGVPANGYLEYVLELPAGGFILGFLHTTLSGSTGGEEPTPISGFRLQISDVVRNYRMFGKPVPEAWLLNDQLGTDNTEFNSEWVLNPAPRLLAAPYPIAPPGQFKVEFWETTGSLNKLVQVSMIVAVPPGGNNGK